MARETISIESWAFSVPGNQALEILHAGFEKMHADPHPSEFHSLVPGASTPRSLRKKRWAADWHVQMEGPSGEERTAVITLFAGNKSTPLLDELAGHCGEAVLSRE